MSNGNSNKNRSNPMSALKGDFYSSRLADPEWFWQKGLRVADLLIMVDRGKTGEVAAEVFESLDMVTETSWRVNAVANMFAHCFYRDTRELNHIIETIKSIEHVTKVEFSEIVEVVAKREDEEVRRTVERMTASGIERR